MGWYWEVMNIANTVFQWKAGGHCAVAKRAGASGGAGADAAGLL